mmetsp:Transcript_24698/g.68883  ORF Transcript_24698/g.68883 Transcript_24698/m.68883 type:complete len:336 (+) Transcript_24698:99-1106(+)
MGVGAALVAAQDVDDVLRTKAKARGRVAGEEGEGPEPEPRRRVFAGGVALAPGRATAKLLRDQHGDGAQWRRRKHGHPAHDASTADAHADAVVEPTPRLGPTAEAREGGAGPAEEHLLTDAWNRAHDVVLGERETEAQKLAPCLRCDSGMPVRVAITEVDQRVPAATEGQHAVGPISIEREPTPFDIGRESGLARVAVMDPQLAALVGAETDDPRRPAVVLVDVDRGLVVLVHLDRREPESGELLAPEVAKQPRKLGPLAGRPGTHWTDRPLVRHADAHRRNSGGISALPDVGPCADGELLPFQSSLHCVHRHRGAVRRNGGNRATVGAHQKMRR